MKSFFFAVPLLLTMFLHSADAQLPAPGAFDDFSGCSADGCIWVPMFARKQVYVRDDLSYSVHALENPESGVFTLRRGTKILYRTNLKGLSASVSVAWSSTDDWFAITWSTGGAIGIFHTRIFHLTGDKVTETDTPLSALHDFRARHSCRARGENVQAYRWDEETDSVVLVMSVYPTSDCGKEMGHTEAYFVSPSDGEVRRHLNRTELQAYMKNRKSKI